MKHTTLKTLKVMTTVFALALVLVAGLCNSLPEHGSGFGIGVLRAKQTSPFDEGVFGVHGPRRFLLHVHALESRGDQGRLEGLL
jgi:hypothetical protein